jgi:hypothetical protein
MKITKEIAYLYLKDSNTMSKYTNDFVVVDIYSEMESPGVNPHPVIRCEYIKDDVKSHKNVHVNLIKIRDWIKSHRESLLDEILK